MFFGDAVEALEHRRHVTLYLGELVQGADVGHPVIHTAGVNLPNLPVQSFQHTIL